MINKIMNPEIRLYALNLSAVAFSLTTITDILRIAVLVVTLAYTAHKLWVNITKKKSQ